MKKKLVGLILSLTVTGMLCACGNTEPAAPAQDVQTETVSDEADSNEQVQSTDEDAGEAAETVSETDDQDSSEAEVKTPVEKNGEVYILVTSDVHCGVNQGFGYAGLAEVRQSLEDQGYTTILVDDGDSIQGEAMGTLTQGEADIRLMNAVGYDVVIPGNQHGNPAGGDDNGQCALFQFIGGCPGTVVGQSLFTICDKGIHAHPAHMYTHGQIMFQSLSAS